MKTFLIEALLFLGRYSGRIRRSRRITGLLLHLIDNEQNLKKYLGEYVNFKGMSPEEFKRLYANQMATIAIIGGEGYFPKLIWLSKHFKSYTEYELDARLNNPQHRLGLFLNFSLDEYLEDIRHVIELDGKPQTTVLRSVSKNGKFHFTSLTRWTARREELYLYTILRDVTAEYKIKEIV